MLIFLIGWFGIAYAVPLPAHTAIRAGVCSDAAISGFTPATDADYLALARCQLIAGEPARARSTLGRIDNPELGSYAGLIRAEALLAEERFDESADLLATLELTGDAADRARMLQGHALVEAGRHVEARPLLSGMLDDTFGAPGVLATPGGADPAEVRWWLAEGAVRRGAADRAIPVWRNIWSRNPTSSRADDAAAALADQGHPVPDASTAAGQSLIRERISTLESLHLYREAWELRQELPPDTTNSGNRSAARSLFRAKDYEQAVIMYARIANPTAQDRYDHALAMSRTGDYAAAARLYQQLIDAHPQHSLADTASYKLGYLAYDEHRLSDAIPLLEQHLVQYPRTEHGDEAQWFIGWSRFRLGDYAASDTAFTELLREHPSSSLATAARYWRARIADIEGRTEEARTGYEEVLRRWPSSGYSWWAANRLGRAYEAPTPIQRPALPAVLQTPGYALGLELARAGLKEWARAELQPYRSRVSGNRAAQLYLAEALVEAGDYRGAQSLARPYCGSPGSRTGDAWAIQLCWPRPEVATLDPELAELELPGNLSYAIMTAESALQPAVTSPAGARGLMQLMPEVADGLHQDRFPGAPYHPDQLYDPAYNALLGTSELGVLRQRFGADSRILARGIPNAHLPLVIAGYNGGPDAVERWLNQAEGHIEGDIFMENIGYSETRRYVRRVLGYMQTYRLIYGD